MISRKANLILHPARHKILLALAVKPMTTKELDIYLSDVPKSSIYRHLRDLVQGGMIEVAETRPVKGTVEKKYRLAKIPHLNQEDISGLSRQDHLRYFAMFLASHLQGFANYLESREISNFQTDHVGYTETIFYASSEDHERIQTGIQKVIQENSSRTPVGTGHPHLMAFISYPFIKGVEPNE